MLSILLTGNDLFKFIKVNNKNIAEYVGDDPERLHNIQKGSQLLHHILSQFFPLSAIAGMGTHARWKTEPHFDEASYNIMHNVMHNEHSPQTANQLLIQTGQDAKYSVSPEDLFTKSQHVASSSTLLVITNSNFGQQDRTRNGIQLSHGKTKRYSYMFCTS